MQIPWIGKLLPWYGKVIYLTETEWEQFQKGDYMPDRSKYFTGGSWLSAEDVKHGQLLTVEHFEEIKTKDGPVPVLRFKGMDAAFRLNATNFDRMTEKFGENEKNWSGRKVRVVIVKATNPKKGGKLQDAIRIE